MTMTPTQATLLAMLISKATDIAVQQFNKKADLSEEELDALINNEEALTKSLIDEFNAI